MLWMGYGRISQEGVKGMVTNPSNRAEAVGKFVEAFGGKLISYYLSMTGDIDYFIVYDMPDDKIAGAAVVNSMILRASGGIETFFTVPVVRGEDAIKQMQKAQQMISAMAYQAPNR